MARDPGPTSFGRQNVTGSTQPSNISAVSGNRAIASRVVMDSTRSQRDEGRRRTVSTFNSYGPPWPDTSRASRPATPDEPVTRRPFAGGILQRLANIQRSTDGAPSTLSTQSGSRGVPPPPVGGRPFGRHRRVTHSEIMQIDDAPLLGRISSTPVPTSAAPEVPRREGVPWRSFISGLRGPEAADSASGSSAVPIRAPPPPEERASRLRSLRQRVQLDRGDGSMPRANRTSMWRSGAARRNFPSGDYVVRGIFGIGSCILIRCNLAR